MNKKTILFAIDVVTAVVTIFLTIREKKKRDWVEFMDNVVNTFKSNDSIHLER